MDRVSCPLHTSFKQVGHAQLFSDFAQVIGALLYFWVEVLEMTFKRCNFREPSQDFILNAVREIRVRFFVTQVFEGKNGDALVGNGDIRRRRGKLLRDS